MRSIVAVLAARCRRGRGWHETQDGQALVVIALGVAVLLSALALGLDWGYALTQRRIVQNEADAATMAVAKGLATSVLMVNGSAAFGLHQEEASCVARSYVAANADFVPRGSSSGVVVQFGDAASPPNWTTAASSPACPPSGALTPIPASTRLVRVEASVQYPTLLGAVTGQRTLLARASARARLSGTSVPLQGPVWPMVRHYNASDFNISAACPPATCDPTSVPPITFWSPNASDVVYGNFKGLVDLSRYSTRMWPTLAAQLESDWDRTGSLSAVPPTTPKADHSGNCAGGWDTAGDEAPSNQDKQCSIPNWYYYAFQGRVSLSSTWSGASLPANQETPSAIGSRSICASPPDPAPSCADPTVGDWIETAGGNVGQNMSDNMRARIGGPEGSTTPFSSQVVANGPNKGNVYGKALTILVYLWDCAESYDGSAALGSRWTLVTSRGKPDCAQLTAGGNSQTPDRVHLFTAAPFTFYEGLVTTQAIEGYWGGSFGDPRSCQSCALNALSNTAFFVPDD